MSTPDVPLTSPLPPDLRPGVYRLRSDWTTSAIQDQLEGLGWAVSVVDLVWAADKEGVMSSFASGLHFPSWFGRNWDALDDSLRDLSWWPAGTRGRSIIVRGAGRATTGTAADREMVRDVLEAAADSWAETDSPLLVLLRR